MQEDLLYEANAETERIVAAYGDPYNSSSDSYILSDPYPDSDLRLPEFADDDVNENTDTDDGADEVTDIVSASERLITVIAKQGENVNELVGVNTRLIALIAKQRETLARLRARINRLLACITQFPEHGVSGELMTDSAHVLMDTTIDTSFLLKPNYNSDVDVHFLRNSKITKELQD